MDIKDMSIMILPARTGLATLPSGIAKWLEVHMGDGTINIGEGDNIVSKSERGRITEVTEGDEKPLEVSWQGKFDYMQSPVPESLSIYEALLGSYDDATSTPWSVWQSQNQKREDWYDCPPYCVCLEIHRDTRRTCPDSPIPGEIIWVPFWRADNVPASIKGATLNLSGKANVRDYISLPIENADWGYDAFAPVKPYDLW